MSYPGDFSFKGINFKESNSVKAKYPDKERSNFQYGIDPYLNQFKKEKFLTK